MFSCSSPQALSYCEASSPEKPSNKMRLSISLHCKVIVARSPGPCIDTTRTRTKNRKLMLRVLRLCLLSVWVVLGTQAGVSHERSPSTPLHALSSAQDHCSHCSPGCAEVCALHCCGSLQAELIPSPAVQHVPPTLQRGCASYVHVPHAFRLGIFKPPKV